MSSQTYHHVEVLAQAIDVMGWIHMSDVQWKDGKDCLPRVNMLTINTG